MTSLLEGVVERTLPWVFSGFDRSLAGKTNDAKELWFIGSTPELAVGVFLGYDRLIPPQASAAILAMAFWKGSNPAPSRRLQSPNGSRTTYGRGGLCPARPHFLPLILDERHGLRAVIP